MLNSTAQLATGGLKGRCTGLERSQSARLPAIEALRPAASISRYASQECTVPGGPASTSGRNVQTAAATMNHEPETSDTERVELAPDSIHQQLLANPSDWLSNLHTAGNWLTENGQFPSMGSLLPIQTQTRTQTDQKKDVRPPPDPKKREDFYANVGEAIRVLRAEIPTLFQKDLSYHIYRDDIVFRDPKNSFQGMKDYKTIFWSLRFHGKLFFKVLYVDVLRIWESPKNVTDAGTILKMRWSVHGIPRVPWDAEGVFDGISTFRLDSSGKIFEHEVNNVILRDPPKEGNPFLAGLNLIALPQRQQAPCPGAWFRAHCKEQKEWNGGTQ